MVAPVVGCGSCAAGSAPARAAAVWLSVWGSGDNREAIHTRPDRHRSPSPSVLLHQLSPPTVLTSHPPPRPARQIAVDHTLSFTSPICLSVFLSQSGLHPPTSLFLVLPASLCLPPHTETKTPAAATALVGKKMKSTAKSPQQQPESKFAEHPWAIWGGDAL